MFNRKNEKKQQKCQNDYNPESTHLRKRGQKTPNEKKQRKGKKERVIPGEILIIGRWVSEGAARGGVLSLQEGFWKWVFVVVVVFGGREGARASCRGIGGGRGRGRISG